MEIELRRNIDGNWTSVTVEVKDADRVRLTDMAGVRGLAEDLLYDQAVLDSVDTDRPQIRLDLRTIRVSLKGAPLEDVNELLDFLSSIIVDASEVIEDWHQLDDEKQRDAIDQKFDLEDMVNVFAYAWTHYSGLIKAVMARSEAQDSDDTNEDIDTGGEDGG